MKKAITLLAAVAFMLAAPLVMCAQSIKAGSRITVAPPILQNGEAADAWVPLFVQGQLTADLQNYSGLTVIDRQAATQLMGEQSIKEQNAYMSGSDADSIQYASLIDADYTVVVQLVKKGASYALTCSIQNVKTSSQLGKTYTNANVQEAALNDGSAIHTASYALLKELGIAESSLAELSQQIARQTAAQQAEVAAQQSLARGIAAEQQGTNIEALTYYIQARKTSRNLSEATSRMASMTTVVTGGNFGENAKNQMKLRNDWDKLLLEAAGLMAANEPQFELRYFSDITPGTMTEEDYENETMPLGLSTPYMVEVGGESKENAAIAGKLLSTLQSIPQSKNWGKKINGFPWTYADDIGGDNWLQKANNGTKETYEFTISILDQTRKVIATRDVPYVITYAKQYGGWDMTTGLKAQNDKKYTPHGYNFKATVGDADTDALYISIENKGINKVSIVPVPEGTVSTRNAMEVIATGKHDGMVKVGGYLGAWERGVFSKAMQAGGKPISLDLSELQFDSGSKLVRSSLVDKDGMYVDRNGMYFDSELLTSIVLPSYPKSIAMLNLRDHKVLTSVTIPDGVMTISLEAFSGCTSLTSVTISESVTRIAPYAFYGCTSLKTVSIPESVTELYGSAFKECRSLKTIYYAGSKEQWEEALKETSREIRDGVKIIYNYKGN